MAIVATADLAIRLWGGAQFTTKQPAMGTKALLESTAGPVGLGDSVGDSEPAPKKS